MIKKITMVKIEKLPRKLKKQHKNCIKKILNQEPDTFEYSQKTVRKAEQVKKAEKLNDCDNLEFKTEKLEFFKDDVEKMKTMSLEEEIEYLRNLKQQKKYNVIKSPND